MRLSQGLGLPQRVSRGDHAPVSSTPALAHARSRDGSLIGWRASGQGPTLVLAPGWFGRIEHDREDPTAQPVVEALQQRHRLVCHDLRGCGASPSPAQALGFERAVDDLEAVVDAAAAPRFALLGRSQGAAIAIAYAARHPQRVSRLVLHGGFVQGAIARDPSPLAQAESQTMARLAELGWGRADAAFRQVFTTQIIPGASRVQQSRLNDVQRLATSAANAAGWLREIDRIDVSALLPLVRCPTLVLHSRHDCRVPFDQGRMLASGIADAEFVSLDSPNHLLLGDEPAWRRWQESVNEFLAPETMASGRAQMASLLTERQRRLVELLARGQNNAQIAQQLKLSEKTVRNQIGGVFDRLEVENRGQAIVRALQSGFGTTRSSS